MATLTVGIGQQYATIGAAVAASHDGDLLQVQAGTYTNDFATINTKITLQGVGGMVKMVASGSIPNDKGILITNTDVTIDHFEFTGAAGASGNDAGIRYQGGNLVVSNSYFHDNQNGLLSNPSTTGTITIKSSEFANNGAGDGYTHNLYVGDIASLTITDSYFHDANVGHEIKSRAEVTTITNTRVFDNNSTSSYSIDLPNGGKAVLSGNTIQQGVNGQNPVIVAYGEEGGLHAGSSLTMTNNVVVNDLTSHLPTVLNDASNTAATVTGTQVYGLGAGTAAIYGNGVTLAGTTFLTSHPTLDTSHPWSAAATTPPPSGGGGTTTPPPVAGPIIQGDNGASVTGTSGADTIVMGLGGGRVTGGAGADTFDFNALPRVADHITDFKHGTDKIDITDLMRASGYGGADPVTDGYLSLVYKSGSTTLYYDADGHGAGKAVALVTLDGVAPTSLDWSDLQFH